MLKFQRLDEITWGKPGPGWCMGNVHFLGGDESLEIEFLVSKETSEKDDEVLDEFTAFLKAFFDHFQDIYPRVIEKFATGEAALWLEEDEVDRNLLFDVLYFYRFCRYNEDLYEVSFFDDNKLFGGHLVNVHFDKALTIGETRIEG